MEYEWKSKKEEEGEECCLGFHSITADIAIVVVVVVEPINWDEGISVEEVFELDVDVDGGGNDDDAGVDIVAVVVWREIMEVLGREIRSSE